MTRTHRKHQARPAGPPPKTLKPEDDAAAFRKNFDISCTVCDDVPTVGDTGLCGPHCFGEADTMHGNW